MLQWKMAVPPLICLLIFLCAPYKVVRPPLSPEKIKLHLHYYDYGGQGTSVMIAVIARHIAAQQDYQYLIGRGSEHYPVIKMHPRRWKSAFSLVVNGQAVSSSGLTLLRAPKIKYLALRPDAHYRVLFAVPPGSFMPGDTVQLLFRHHQQSIYSRPLVIQSAGGQDSITLTNRLRISAILGNTSQVKLLAEQLIELEPASAEAYWYKGLAAEFAQQWEEALMSYKQAARRLTVSRHTVPRFLLLKRLGAVQRRLQIGNTG